MRIKKLLVRGFGKLINREIHLPENKVALIARPNESGKTALLEAIIAGLYGLPEKERASRTKVPLKTVYEPWESEEFGLELDVEVQSSHVRLIRDFGGKRYQAMNLTSGEDLTPSTNGEGARAWLGISAEDFRRLSCISGKETLQLSDSGGVRERLEELLSGSELTAEAAAKLIEHSTQRYRDPNGNLVLLSTAIARAQAQLSEAETRKTEMEAQRAQRSAEIAEMEDLERRIEALKAEEEEAGAEEARLRLAEINERLARHQHSEMESLGLQQEAEALEYLKDFPQASQDTLTRLAISVQTNAPVLLEKDTQLEEIKGKLDELEGELGQAGLLAEAGQTQADLLRDSATVLRELERDQKAVKGQLESLGRLLDQNSLTEESAERLYNCFDSALYDDQLAITTWIERTRVYDQDREGYRRSEEEKNGAKDGLLKRKALHKRFAVVSAFLMVCAAAFGGVSLFAGVGPVFYVCTGLSALFLLLCAVQANQALSRKTEIASLDKSLGEIALEYAKRSAELEELHKKADKAAQNLGLESGRAAAEDWLQYVGNRHLIREWARVHTSMREMSERLEAAQFKAISVAAECGQQLSTAETNSTEIQRLALAASQMMELSRERAQIKARYDTLSSEVEALREQLSRQKQEILEILQKAGIPPQGGLDEATAQFVEQAEKTRRYHYLTSELLPARQVGLIPGEELSALLSEKAELETRLVGLRTGPQTSQAAGQARARLDEIRSQLQFTTARHTELSAGLWETLNRIRQDLPQVEDDAARLQAYLDRAQRFQKAAEIAIGVLSDVGENARRQWALWLNSAANGMLKELDVNWSDVVFSEDLSFKVRDASSGRWLDMLEASAHLSSGARDQVWFAARTGICRALSRDEAVPILLDDPFLTWDDPRFRKGMRLLAERVNQDNQVILVTCHEDRHRLMEREDPEWFHEHFALVEL